jgi:hypothetical protein
MFVCSLRCHSALPSASQVPDFQITPIEFDKDVDAQMRVVAAVSNLRARNYSIPEADLHTSRGIAGKITPAIATTTAMVTAAICVELYKLLLDKPIDQLKNTFSNLALPLFTSAEPDPPKSTKAKVNGKDWVWTAVSFPSFCARHDPMFCKIGPGLNISYIGALHLAYTANLCLFDVHFSSGTAST